MIGRVVNHYRILEKIGSGGMGEVYLAEDLTLDRRVALKVLNAESRDHPTRSARFEREVKAIAAINHPNVVTLYTVEQSDGERFLSMEWVDGTTLADQLQDGEKLPLNRFLDIAIPLVQGLRAAHALGIAHRDLKPRNVMIDREGRVKLLDFGLASWREASRPRREGDDDDLTRTGTVIGTPAYMSPEQLCGLEIDPRSDIFSLGVLFYELLAGHRPFGGSTPTELATFILRDEPRPLAEANEDLPEKVHAIVERCLQKQPEDRYQDAATLLADLEELQLESQVQAITGTYRRQQRRRQRLRAITLWVGVILALVLGVLAAGWWRELRSAPSFDQRVVPVVSWSGLQSDSHRSPDGRWISFVGTQFEPGTLFIQRVEGGQPQQLSVAAGATNSHVWSEDGSQVALLVTQGGRSFVQIVQPFGATVERTLPLPGQAHYRRLVRWLSQQLYVETTTGLVRLDTTNGRTDQLITAEGGNDRLADFDISADQRRVVFQSLAEGRPVLWMSDLDGSDRTDLSPHEGKDTSPRWLGPDADLVVVTSDRRGNPDLWLVPVDAPKLATLLVASSGLEEVDDSSLTEHVATFRETNRKVDLYLTGGGIGSEMMAVTTGAVSANFASLSTDERWIAYQETDPRLASTLYPFGSKVVVAPFEASEPIGRRSELAEGGLPSISPDGDRVAFVRLADGAFELVIHDVDSHYEQTVTREFAFPGLDFPSLEPNTERILWTADGSLYFVEGSPRGGQRLLRWSPESEAAPIPISTVETPGTIDDLRLGDDGAVRWIRSSVPRFAEPDQDRVFDVFEVVADQPPTLLLNLELAPSRRLYLLGTADDRVPLLSIAEPNPDWTSRVAVAAARQGQLDELVTLDRVIPTSFVHDHRNGRILFTVRDLESGNYNLWEYSLERDSRRQLTFNRKPGVLYSGPRALTSGVIVMARTELISTINLLELEER